MNVNDQRAVIVCSIAEVDTSILKSHVYEYKLCLKGINWYLVTQLTVRDSLTVDVIPVWCLSVQVASEAHILTKSSKYNLAKTIGEGVVCKIEGYERDPARLEFKGGRCCLFEIGFQSLSVRVSV